MKGRKPKPTEQKRREGNPGRRPLGEPVLVGERLTGTELDASAAGGELVETLHLPPCPDTLALADELDDSTAGGDLWREACTLLIEAGIATAGDLYAIEQFVMATLESRRAFFELRTEGSTVDTVNPAGDRAGKTTHPAYRVWRDSNATMLRWAEHLGLTPVARARLGLAVGKGRKLAQELERGLPENPLTRRGVDADAEGTIDTEGDADFGMDE